MAENLDGVGDALYFILRKALFEVCHLPFVDLAPGLSPFVLGTTANQCRRLLLQGRFQLRYVPLFRIPNGCC